MCFVVWVNTAETPVYPLTKVCNYLFTYNNIVPLTNVY